METDESIIEERRLINEEIEILEEQFKIFIKKLETFRDHIDDLSVAKEFREKAILMDIAHAPMKRAIFESQLRLIAKLK